jgi:CheY-like chemotaxis protein
MHVVLLSADLMMISAAQGAGDRHGVELKIAGNDEQAIELSHGAAAVALDLRTPGLNVGALVPRLRKAAKPQAAVAACGPHVHTEALTAAAEAGCDEVITRGQFEHRFDALLAALTAPAAKDQK